MQVRAGPLDPRGAMRLSVLDQSPVSEVSLAPRRCRTSSTLCAADRLGTTATGWPRTTACSCWPARARGADRPGCLGRRAHLGRQRRRDAAHDSPFKVGGGVQRARRPYPAASTWAWAAPGHRHGHEPRAAARTPPGRAERLRGAAGGAARLPRGRDAGHQPLARLTDAPGLPERPEPWLLAPPRRARSGPPSWACPTVRGPRERPGGVETRDLPRQVAPAAPAAPR